MAKTIHLRLTGQAEQLYEQLIQQGLSEEDIIGKAFWLLNQVVTTNRVAFLKNPEQVIEDQVQQKISMSEHFDEVPDPRHELTDLYVFQKPGEPTKSFLNLDVNSAVPTFAIAFDSEASYQFKNVFGVGLKARRIEMRMVAEP